MSATQAAQSEKEPPMTPAALACQAKMRAAKVNETCIRAFLRQHAFVSSGQSAFIRDADIAPIEMLDKLEGLTAVCSNNLLEQTVVMKLNGGLGTGMGLQDAKSLLPVKADANFLDFTARQIRYLREHQGKQLRFMLMNSFNTVKSTKAYLKKYPEIYDSFDTEVHLMQNEVPKLLQGSLEPAVWPANPACEWAPPGHGDLFTALYGSGKLDELIKQGYKYMFVSNGDNLGATLEPHLLAYMEQHRVHFLMEVCRRTESDKKGGHLAQRVVTERDPDTGVEQTKTVLLLRESAQCTKEDEANFQNIHKYCYFNTNNLWIHLPHLAAKLEQYDGALPLPVICNAKTVDPTQPQSPKVFQLETAMGSAISLFDHAAAVVVPRERFAPVKTCADLLALRSDAYIVTKDERLVLDSRCNGAPPVIHLDPDYYKMISGFNELVARGVPSLVHCTKLTIRGPVHLGANMVIKGDVVIDNAKKEEWWTLEDNAELRNTVLSR